MLKTQISFTSTQCVNVLSDHEAQYLCVNTTFDGQRGNIRFVKKRLITKSLVSVFIYMLKNKF